MAGSVILAAGCALGWLGLVLGVGATLFANLESGLPHGQLAAVVATWPAVAFTVASFMLERWLKSQVGNGPVLDRHDQETPVAIPAVPGPSAALNGHSTGWAAAPTSGWS